MFEGLPRSVELLGYLLALYTLAAVFLYPTRWSIYCFVCGQVTIAIGFTLLIIGNGNWDLIEIGTGALLVLVGGFQLFWSWKNLGDPDYQHQRTHWISILK